MKIENLTISDDGSVDVDWQPLFAYAKEKGYSTSPPQILPSARDTIGPDIYRDKHDDRIYVNAGDEWLPVEGGLRGGTECAEIESCLRVLSFIAKDDEFTTKCASILNLRICRVLARDYLVDDGWLAGDMNDNVWKIPTEDVVRPLVNKTRRLIASDDIWNIRFEPYVQMLISPASNALESGRSLVNLRMGQ